MLRSTKFCAQFADKPRDMARSIEFLEKLGTGGMAEVFKVRHTGAAEFQKIFALKRIHPLKIDDPKIKKFFEKEAKIMATLRHPGIAEVFDYWFDEKGLPCILMEFIEGETLRDAVMSDTKKSKTLGTRTKFELIKQIQSALDFAHQKKVIHGDLSPHNIMIDAHGRAKILDFGVARIVNSGALFEQTHTEQISGKFGYLAPELKSGANQNRETDYFAAGVTFVELLMGEKLFPMGVDPQKLDSDSIQELIQHLEKVGYGQSLAEALVALLSVNPKLRAKGWKQLGSVSATDAFSAESIDTTENGTVPENTETVFQFGKKSPGLRLQKKFNLRAPLVYLGAAALVLIGSGILFFKPKRRIPAATFEKLVSPIKIVVRAGDYGKPQDISPEPIDYDFSESEGVKFFSGTICEHLGWSFATTIMLLDEKSHPNPDKNIVKNMKAVGTALAVRFQFAEKMCGHNAAFRYGLKLHKAFMSEVSESDIYAPRETLRKRVLASAIKQLGAKEYLDHESTKKNTLKWISDFKYFEIQSFYTGGVANGLNLYSNPNQKRIRDRLDCEILGSRLFADYLNEVKTKDDGENFAALVLPDKAEAQFKGFDKTNGAITLVLPKENPQDSKIFKEGICYYRISETGQVETHFWVPIFGTQGN